MFFSSFFVELICVVIIYVYVFNLFILFKWLYIKKGKVVWYLSYESGKVFKWIWFVVGDNKFILVLIEVYFSYYVW